MKFSELHLNGNVLEALDAMRFEECTPIQEKYNSRHTRRSRFNSSGTNRNGKNVAAYLLPIL